VTNDYTIVDVHTGRGHDRPTGTEGDADTPNDAVEETFPPPTPAAPGDDETVDTPGTDVDSATPDGTDPVHPADPAALAPDARVADPDVAAPSDPSTTTTTTSETPATTATTAPTGQWIASQGCGLGTESGHITFEQDGSYTLEGPVIGHWTRTGDELTLTSTTDTPGTVTATLSEDAAPVSDTTGCTLSPVSS
jgi:hypothetical protein